MRKKIVFIVPTLVVTLVTVAIILFLCSWTSDQQKSLTPADIVITGSPEQEEPPVFDKSNLDGHNVVQFLFKDLGGGCIYSLDQKIFLFTELSDVAKVSCFLACATEEECTPVAITTTGNYLILQTGEGEKIAVQMEPYQSDEIITPTEPLLFENLPDSEKDSLFELIGE